MAIFYHIGKFFVLIGIIIVKNTLYNESTKSTSTTPNTGATPKIRIGISFMYIKTSADIYGHNVFVSLKRIDNKQITNITFDYNRLSSNNLKLMGCFRNQLLLADNAWSTKYNIAKNYRISNLSKDWKLVILKYLQKTLE